MKQVEGMNDEAMKYVAKQHSPAATSSWPQNWNYYAGRCACWRLTSKLTKSFTLNTSVKLETTGA